MISQAMNAIVRGFEERSQLPFCRMVRLFVARIFRGGGDSDSGGLDLGVGLVLTLLALPGGFVSILLFEKYGTLLQWMRGNTTGNAMLRAGLPAGWQVGDKTGRWNGDAPRGYATNDIAIVTPQGRKPILIVCYTQGGPEAHQAVISGSMDIACGGGIESAIGGFSKGVLGHQVGRRERRLAAQSFRDDAVGNRPQN